MEERYEDATSPIFTAGEASLCVLSLMVLLCRAPGCGGQQAPAPQAQDRYSTLQGTVISIDRPEQRIVVDHEEIPGFMAAMAMPYPVADPNCWTSPHPATRSPPMWW